MKPRASPPRVNNFDLIRIAAALQVAVFHFHDQLELAGQHPWLDRVVGFSAHFPGVPIFFVVSGFLISWAGARSASWKEFARNRAIRIYPAMWVALLVTITILVVRGFINGATFAEPQMLAWYAGQITIGQFYTAPQLRGYGLGNPNGSLWTIVVELQFYVILPFLLGAARRWGARVVLPVLAAASFAVNLWVGGLPWDSMTTKLLHVTIAPWLFYFLFGVAAFTSWHRIGPPLVKRATFVALLVGYLAYSGIVGDVLGTYKTSYFPHALGLVEVVLLAALTLSAAFQAPHNLSERVLRKNDLSYGLYIYHAIALNLIVDLRLPRDWSMLACGIALSVVAGAISWVMVEKPALSLKRRPLVQPDEPARHPVAEVPR